jgi:iron complex outermembrane receptor protein
VFITVLIFQLIVFPVMAEADSGEAAAGVELGVVEVVEEREPTPYSQVIITEEELEAENPTDTGDMLKKVPGISAKRTGLFGLDPVMRGFREDQLNVLIDGTRIWGACPSRMDPPSSQIGVDELEAIEIIRGPFSVRHGAGGLGGVINLITKQPRRYEKPEFHGRLAVGYDEVADGKRGNLSLYGGDRPYDYRLSITGRNYEDYDSAEGRVDNSSFEDLGYSAKIGLNPAQDHRLELAVAQIDGRDIYYPARLMDAEKHGTLLSSIKYRWQEVSPWLDSLTGSFYYNAVEHKMNNDDRQSVETMEMETDAEADTYGGKLESVFSLGKVGNLIAGIDYYHLRRDADRTRKMIMPMMTVTMEDKPLDDVRFQDWGFYGELKRDLLPQLELVLGVRLDLVKADSDVPNEEFLSLVEEDNLKQTETNISGNLGLVYNLTREIDLTAAVGRGVRTADANERYAFFFPSSRYFDSFDYLGDPGLDPEQSLEFDVGGRARFDRVSLGLSLFYNRVQDYITGEMAPELVPKTMGAEGVKRYVNVDASLMGFELDGIFKISDSISLRGDLAYTEGENRDSDTYLPQIPPLEGNLAVRYDYGKMGVWGEVAGRFVARQHKIDPDFGETETPGFSTFDIVLGATPFDNVSVILGVDNIFDKKYGEHLNGNDVSSGERLLEPGRNLFAKLSWEF